MSDKPYIIIDKLECKGCGRCLKACPADVIEWSGKLNERSYNYAIYKGEGCTGCGNCYYICPETSAIEVHIPLKNK